MKTWHLPLMALFMFTISPTYADSASVNLVASQFSEALEEATVDLDLFKSTVELYAVELEQEILASWLEGQGARETSVKTAEFRGMNGLEQNLIRTKYLIAEHEKGMARFDLLNLIDEVKAMKDMEKLNKILPRLKRVLSQGQKLRFSMDEILTKI